MKIAFIAASCLLMMFLGWFSLPYLLRPLSGDCRSETLIIYDEPERTVISHGYWDILRGSREGHLNAYLAFISPQGDEKKINVDRTVNLDYTYHIDSLTASTKKSFRIAGPDTQDPLVGKYIDPLADEKFSARIYLFKVGNQVISGFHYRPLNRCMKPTF
ncbi:hypothetical protein [Candidatus Pantoea formicae]|jgi:hypothetical protein|uniref:hypothetical protein n=1 Tax=Candidatus Pantoea formicae TaxID=2608355 RepID=UPI003EDA1A9F